MRRFVLFLAVGLVALASMAWAQQAGPYKVLKAAKVGGRVRHDGDVGGRVDRNQPGTIKLRAYKHTGTDRHDPPFRVARGNSPKQKPRLSPQLLGPSSKALQFDVFDIIHVENDGTGA